MMQPIGGEPFPDSDSKEEPRHVELVRKAFALKDDPRSMYAVQRREAINLLAHDKADELLDKIYSAFENYQAKHDLVVIEGTHEGDQSHRHLPSFWNKSLLLLFVVIPQNACILLLYFKGQHASNLENIR